jgi:lipoprotein-anchoring transpeptidase ErfK/SrfK
VKGNSGWIGLALGALAIATLAAWFLLDTETETDVVGEAEAPADSQLEAKDRDGSPKEAQPPVVRFPGAGSGLVVVRQGAEVELLDEPGGKVKARVDRKTEFGSATVLSVVEKEGRWVGVLSPEFGNGEIGWAKYDPEAMRLGSTRVSIRVDLSQRQVEVLRGKRRINAFTVSVGALGSSTPTGRYAITDVLTGGLGVYGCCAVALSAHQPDLPPDWIGGDRIAIHGWSGPVGDAVSNGCLRASNRDMSAFVDQARLGVPVFIHA